MDAIKVKEDINELVKFGRLCSLMLFYKRYKNLSFKKRKPT